MKKNLNVALLRSLCTLIIGGLMVAFSTEVSLWLVYGLGTLIVISGVAALVAHLLRPKGEPSNIGLLIVAIVGMVGGASFLLNSETNSTYLFYVLGTLPAIGACAQLISLIRLHRKGMPLPSIAYMVPLLIIALCVGVLYFKDQLAQLPILLLGIAWLAYSFFELVLLFRWSKVRTKETNTTATNMPKIENVTDIPAEEITVSEHPTQE